MALLPDLPGFCMEQIIRAENRIIITARAISPTACCPDCQQPSSRVHSYYTRSPLDLPSSGRPVALILGVRHFRCANALCSRKTFAEPLPNLLLPHAQRTTRLRGGLQALGEDVGGEAGARASKRQGMACSADTILRLTKQATLPTTPPVKVLGVDEWAWRKGQSYGTMLVDLQRHIPVDVLPDASADSFAAWLKANPGIELITRDRAGTFADGAALGAPKALQIADRWHLLRNLSEALKKVLARHHDSLKRAFTPLQEQQEAPPAPAPVVISHAERIQQSRRDRRLARYQEVRKRDEQGWSFASIARMLGMNKKTVAKFVQAEQFPEARPRGDRRRKLTPYLPYLQQQWETGQHNAAKLYRDIRAQGFRGSETTVRAYLSELRDETEPRTGPRRRLPVSAKRKSHWQHGAPSSRRATWLILSRQEKLSEEQRRERDLVLEAHPEVAIACLLAQSFAQLVRARNAKALGPWIEQAIDSAVPELGSFVGGIRRDQSAVFAALTYQWSQGQVEGQIQRLKLLKRQSYGQAGFDLLRHRVLARPA
jgi:transposase